MPVVVAPPPPPGGGLRDHPSDPDTGLSTAPWWPVWKRPNSAWEPLLGVRAPETFHYNLHLFSP